MRIVFGNQRQAPDEKSPQFIASPNILAQTRGLAPHSKSSCEISSGMGLSAVIRAWRGIFGEKGSWAGDSRYHE